MYIKWCVKWSKASIALNVTYYSWSSSIKRTRIVFFFRYNTFLFKEKSIKHEVQPTVFYWINIVQMMTYNMESLVSDTFYNQILKFITAV